LTDLQLTDVELCIVGYETHSAMLVCAVIVIKHTGEPFCVSLVPAENVDLNVQMTLNNDVTTTLLEVSERMTYLYIL